ncbi:MAG: NAD(P)H-hydrate dehydratase [Clostridia bacterium]|nr:NAD(P)H-hydrate dehydratase [Clostridia bacterium]
MYVLTAQNMKKAEEKANEAGLSYFTMMERAGNACGDVISGFDKNSKVVILCGKGKNGGDGLVIAARLWQNGFRNVFVVLVHGEITDGLCLEMYDNMVRYPVVVTDFNKEKETAEYHIGTADVVVDAVFGIGFKGELADSSAKAVALANENKSAYKYAVDIPSGLAADGTYNGQLYFNADETLSMIAYKPVHVIKPAAIFCGKTTVIDIGIDEKYVAEFAENYTVLTADEASENIRKRMYNDHKGTYGKVLTVCGSRNMPGCVYLCNQAAVEIGAGLVISAFPECIYSAVTPKMNEPVLLPLENNDDGRISRLACKKLADKMADASVIAIGCGLGVDSDTKQLVRFIVESAACPVILDADALNCISKNSDILKNAKCDILITPHPGEMARLTGETVAEIEKNRVAVATEFAKEYGVTVLLKGANTVIADKDGRVAVNATGNPSMARGGSGDVLTGIIAGLVPQTEDVYSAACTGAYIHGATGDAVVEKYGILSATPTRMVQNINS